MKKRIEIYVRNSEHKNMLMFHIPESMKERLVEGIMNGYFEDYDASIHLELSILNEWKDEDTPEHVRIDVGCITVNYEE